MAARKYGILSAITVLTGVLAGCGGGGGGGGNNGQPNTPQGMAGDTFGITSQNRLVSFNRASPSTGTAMAVTGLQPGENLIGIDMRAGGTPAGQLIALSDQLRVYTINPNSGAATMKSMLTADPADTTPPLFTGQILGTRVSVDFNNVADLLRVVTNTGQNLRFNVDNGLVSADFTLAVGGSASIGVNEVAYTNNFSATCRNTVYYLDTTADRLMTSASAVTGILTPVGGLTVDAAAMAGFDIATGPDGTNTGFAALTVNNTTSLYNINLMTGAATVIGPIGQLNAGETLLGLALPGPGSTPPQPVGELLAVTEANRLVSFNSGLPSKLCTSAPFTGLQNGNETVYGVDLRPSDGNIYALTSAAKLYTVNPTTATANFVANLTPNAGDPFTTLNGTNFTIDVSPTADALRVLSDAGQNLAVILPGNPTLAAGTTITATNLNPAGSSITAGTYTNNFTGAGKSTLYVIDTAGDRLQIQGLPAAGSAAGTPNNPNAGNLTTVGSLNAGGDVQPLVGFDVQSVNNTAVAALAVGSATTSSLYTINLQSGAATLQGPIGVSERIRGMTYPTAPRTATVFAVTSTGSLLSFNPATPGQVTVINSVTGMQGGEGIRGFDNRPSNNTLYILSDAGRIYSVNPANAAATLIQAMMAGPFSGGKFGTDFSPPADALRVISDAEQNLAVFPDPIPLPIPLPMGGSQPPAAGTTVAQTSLVRDPSDAGLPSPNVIAVAYSNNFSPPNGTKLYDIDLADGTAANGRLLAQNPAQNGVIKAIGLLDPTATTAFQPIGEIDIAGGEDGIAIAALIPQGQSQSILYRVNLITGALTPVGPIGPAGTQVIGLTVRLQ